MTDAGEGAIPKAQPEQYAFVMMREGEPPHSVTLNPKAGAIRVAFGTPERHAAIWKISASRSGEVYVMERSTGKFLKISLHKRRVHVVYRISTYLPDQQCSLAALLRMQSGGDVAEVRHDDPFIDCMWRLARDAWHSYLMPQDESWPAFFGSMGALTFTHPSGKHAWKQILLDDSLGKLFPEYRSIQEDAFPAVRLRTRYVVPAAAIEQLIARVMESGGRGGYCGDGAAAPGGKGVRAAAATWSWLVVSSTSG